MFGNYVNAIAIIVGCLIGIVIKKGLKDKYKTIVMQGIGLSVLFIGASTTIGGMLNPKSEPILFIVSIVIGAIVGEMIGIERALEKLGGFLQKKVGRGEHNIAQGFVTASLLFCVGTMAILGSLDSGLRDNHNMLLAKSVLDGVTSIILTTTLGIGVIFSAGSVFIYQGAIVLFANFLEPFLTADVIREMSIIGGILIVGIGLNILEIKKIRTANLLPAIFVPAIYYFAVIPLINLFVK